jgi:hypothetical protein
LPALFAKAPHLTPARPQIEAFFQQSSLLFFGGATGTARANAAQDTNTSFGPAIASAATGPSPMVPRSAAPDAAAPGRAIASADRALASAPTGRSSEVPRSAVPAEPVSAVSLPHALCAELRRIERRHEP